MNKKGDINNVAEDELNVKGRLLLNECFVGGESTQNEEQISDVSFKSDRKGAGWGYSANWCTKRQDVKVTT